MVLFICCAAFVVQFRSVFVSATSSTTEASEKATVMSHKCFDMRIPQYACVLFPYMGDTNFYSKLCDNDEILNLFDSE